MGLSRRLAVGGLLVLAVLAGVSVLRHAATGVVLRSVAVGKMPGWVAVDERTNRAFVTNSLDRTVSVLDARSGAVLRTIPVSAEPEALVADPPTRRIFVLGDIFHGAGMLDAASGTLLGTIPVSTWRLLVDDRSGRVLLWGIPAGLSSVSMAILDGRNGSMLRTDARVGAMSWGGGAVDSETHRAFLTNVGSDVVSVVDTSSGRVVRRVAVGQHPVSVAVDSATHHAFVANNWDDTVTMLDARRGTVLRTIKVGPNPARIAVDEQTARVFVVHGRGDPGNNPASALAPFAGISTSGTTVLDARSGAVLGQLAVGGSPLDDVGFVDAMNVAVDERHGRVFVIDVTPTASLNGAATGSVSVLDARSGHLLHTVDVGRHPVALAVDEATARLFVVNTNSGCAGADLWRWAPTSVWRLLPLISQLSRPRCDLQGIVTVIDTSRL